MIRERRIGERGEIRHNFGDLQAVYKAGKWVPLTVNWEKMSFKIQEGTGRRPILRSPDRKPGLADITRESQRIKAFNLREAIVYSYSKNMRFVVTLCVLIGFSLWWFTAPEPLVLKPEALAAPDLKLLYQVVRDTFVDLSSLMNSISSDRFLFCWSSLPHLIFLYKPITGADLSYFIDRVVGSTKTGMEGLLSLFCGSFEAFFRALPWKSSTATLTELI